MSCVYVEKKTFNWLRTIKFIIKRELNGLFESLIWFPPSNLLNSVDLVKQFNNFFHLLTGFFEVASSYSYIL